MNNEKNYDVKFPHIKVAVLILTALYITFFILSFTFSGTNLFLEGFFIWLDIIILDFALILFFVHIISNILIIKRNKKKKR